MLFVLLFVNALFALTYIIVEFALTLTSPLVLLMYRMLFSGIVLILFQFIYDKQLLYIKKTDLLFFGTTSFLHMYINFASETYALQKISGVMVSMFYILTPIFSAIIDYVMTKNVLTKLQWLIIFIASALSVLMIFINNLDNCSVESFTWPYILLLCSIFSSTVAWYRVKILMNNGYSLISINGYASLFSGILFLCMILLNGSFNLAYNSVNTSKIFFSAISLGIIGNIFAYNLYNILLSRYSITSIMLSELIAPCFTSFYSWLLYNKVPQLNHFIFFIIFLFCIMIFNYEENKKKLLENKIN